MVGIVCAGVGGFFGLPGGQFGLEIGEIVRGGSRRYGRQRLVVIAAGQFGPGDGIGEQCGELVLERRVFLLHRRRCGHALDRRGCDGVSRLFLDGVSRLCLDGESRLFLDGSRLRLQGERLLERLLIEEIKLGLFAGSLRWRGCFRVEIHVDLRHGDVEAEFDILVDRAAGGIGRGRTGFVADRSAGELVVPSIGGHRQFLHDRLGDHLGDRRSGGLGEIERNVVVRRFHRIEVEIQVTDLQGEGGVEVFV